MVVVLQDEWQLPGAALLSKAEQMSEVPGELTLSGVCKAHQLFAGATLLLRSCSALPCPPSSAHLASTAMSDLLKCASVGDV